MGGNTYTPQAVEDWRTRGKSNLLAAHRLDSRKEFANARASRVYYALYHFVVARFVENKKLPSDTIPGAWEWNHSTVESRVWECFEDPAEGRRAEQLYRSLHSNRRKADYGPGFVSMRKADEVYHQVREIAPSLGVTL